MRSLFERSLFWFPERFGDFSFEAIVDAVTQAVVKLEPAFSVGYDRISGEAAITVKEGARPGNWLQLCVNPRLEIRSWIGNSLFVPLRRFGLG